MQKFKSAVKMNIVYGILFRSPLKYRPKASLLEINYVTKHTVYYWHYC